MWGNWFGRCGETKQVLLSVGVAKSHIANMLPPGRVVSDRVILQEERGAPQMETPRHFDKENT